MTPHTKESSLSGSAAGLADVGMIGLGVMGRNLALNLADHGYPVVGFDLDSSLVQRLIDEHEAAAVDESVHASLRASPATRRGDVLGATSAADLLAKLSTPRIIVVLVPAGPAVDSVCRALIDAGIDPDDIVVDAGNSKWTDTIRREKEYRGTLTFFGSGVSGGEVGARFGPSLMPGGDRDAWQRLRPIWEAIAAKVDPETGRPIETAAPGAPVTHGEPCAAYIGENGAGHYVKMVHNGIEYADMQLICEAYFLLRQCLNLSPREIAELFAQWNDGELDSYLIEITADILKQDDPVTGRPFVDVVVDAAGQKGTGRWTAVDALNLGVPAMTMAEAVFARAMSALKDQREHAADILSAGAVDEAPLDRDGFIDAVHAALYCSKVCAYAQGFQLLREAQSEYDWSLDLGKIASIWRGGCIIRARFLQKITDAYERDGDLKNLLLDSHFADAIASRIGRWRRVVQVAAGRGVAAPGFASALAYFDSYRTRTLPHNLLQAQRDYFGAHSYERVDAPRGKRFHLDWPEPGRPQIEV